MDNELKTLLSAMKKAGEVILQLQRTNFEVHLKANQDIVTTADLAANDILKSEILGAFPRDGWLSEETSDDKTRLTCNRVWIVDPIDGTKEFAAGLPEYAISVCLVEDSIPKVAAVYNPAVGKLYHAVANHGAWLDDKKLNCHREDLELNILLASRSEYDKGKWEKYKKNYAVKKIGSIAYKLALIAEGAGIATFSLGHKNEWDIAAGVLLVAEAGGNVSDKKQMPILFNQSSTLVDGIVASSKIYTQEIFSIINAV